MLFLLQNIINSSANNQSEPHKKNSAQYIWRRKKYVSYDTYKNDKTHFYPLYYLIKFIILRVFARITNNQIFYNLSKIATLRAIIPGTPTERIHKTKFIFISEVFNLFSIAWNLLSTSWKRFSISCQNSRNEIFKSFFVTRSPKSNDLLAPEMLSVGLFVSIKLRSSLCSMFASRTVHLLSMLHYVRQKVQQKVQLIFDLKMTYNRCKYTPGVFICL